MKAVNSVSEIVFVSVLLFCLFIVIYSLKKYEKAWRAVLDRLSVFVFLKNMLDSFVRT